MPEPTGDPMITEERRREIFAAIVEAQDQCVSVAASRAVIEDRFGISPEKLRSIETEGSGANWPPLE
jgi:hypothetical protein